MVHYQAEDYFASIAIDCLIWKLTFENLLLRVTASQWSTSTEGGRKVYLEVGFPLWGVSRSTRPGHTCVGSERVLQHLRPQEQQGCLGYYMCVARVLAKVRLASVHTVLVSAKVTGAGTSGHWLQKQGVRGRGKRI